MWIWRFVSGRSASSNFKVTDFIHDILSSEQYNDDCALGMESYFIKSRSHGVWLALIQNPLAKWECHEFGYVQVHFTYPPAEIYASEVNLTTTCSWWHVPGNQLSINEAFYEVDTMACKRTTSIPIAQEWNTCLHGYHGNILSLSAVTEKSLPTQALSSSPLYPPDRKHVDYSSIVANRRSVFLSIAPEMWNFETSLPKSCCLQIARKP